MNFPLHVIYEDNHLLVINKPAGLLTQPNETEQSSLEQQAKEWIKEKYQKPGNVFLEAVHRIDKPASGIVVFGRTSKALTRLNEAMRQKQTKKIYYALVEGIPSKTEATLENYLFHDEYRAQVVTKQHPQGKLARLTYTVVRSYKTFTLLEIHLDTGRYHQIRVQLSAIGHPIVGDDKYGSKMSYRDGIALHHGHLEISHPTKPELLILDAPLPGSFPS